MAVVEVILSAKDEASAVLESAGGKLDSFGSKATLLAGGAVAGLGVAVAAVGKSALDMAGEVNQATNDIAAQLGISKTEAEGFEETMKAVFANNFGADFGDIGEGVVALQTQLRDLAPASQEGQQAMLEGAFAIRDAFGVEMSETFNAVNSLMSEFGISGQEALDFVSSGFQRGLDASGDFLDSIGEYAPQFSNAGADAGQFFSLMETGLAGGVLGTDKAADAFKEFRLRILDGSKATKDAANSIFGYTRDTGELTAELAEGEIKLGKLSEALELAKLKQGEFTEKTKESTKVAAQQKIDKLTEAYNAQKEAVERTTFELDNFQAEVKGIVDFEGGAVGFFNALRNGTLDTTDAFELVTQALNTVESDSRRMGLGTALLGTQFEDLGDSAFQALDLTKTSIEDMSGATDSLNQQYDSIGAVFEGAWRQMLVALEPAGEALLELANKAMPVVSDFIESPLTPAIASIAEWLSEKLPEAIESASDFWENTLQPAMEVVTDFIDKTVMPIIEDLVSLFSDSHDEMSKTADDTWGKIQDLIDTAMDAIQKTIETVTSAIEQLWERHGDQLKETAELAWQLIDELIIQNLDSIQDAIETAASAIEQLWEQHGEQIQEIAELAWQLIDELIVQNLDNIQDAIETVSSAIESIWQDHGDTITQIIETAWELIKNTIDAALDQIQNIFELAIAVLQGDWERAWDEIGQILKRAADFMMDTFRILIDGLGGIAQDAIDAVKSAFSGFDARRIGTAASDAIKNGFTSIVSAMRQVARDAVTAIRNSFRVDWSDIGRNISDGIVGGLGDLKGRLVDKAKDAAGGFKDAIGGLFEFGSPSRWMMRAAQQIIDGFVLGWEGAEQRLIEVVENTVFRVQGLITAMADDLIRAVGDLITGLDQQLEQMRNALGGDMTLQPPGAAIGVGGSEFGRGEGTGTDMFIGVDRAAGMGGLRLGQTVIGPPGSLTFGTGLGSRQLTINIENVNGTDRDAANQLAGHIRDELVRNGVC